MNGDLGFPRILLVTYLDVFNDNESETYTVRSFIENWPRENIFQIICEDFNSGDTGRISKNTYRLGHGDIVIGSWLIPGRREVKTTMKSPLTKKSEKNTQSLKSSIRKTVVDLYSFLPYRYTSQLQHFIEDSNPDVLYCCSASVRMFKLCKKIAKKRKIPFIPHIMDDWPNSMYNGSPLSKPLKTYFHFYFSKIIHRAPFVYCICDLMCSEYKKRYSYDRFIPLMNSVNDYSGITIDEIKNRIIYAGSLYLERYKSLLTIAESLSKLNRTDIEIVVYTKHKQWEELEHFFENYSFVRYGGFVTQSELMEQIVSSKYLLFLESMDDEMLDYTRLSMSTKIPEYLSSQRPILAVGNLKQGSIDYLYKNEAAYIISDLANTGEVLGLLLNCIDQNEIVSNAYSLYKKNHIKEQQQILFLNNVLGAIKK